MKIAYTNHAKKKFSDLSELGVKVSKKQVNKVLKNPIHKDIKTDYPNTIVSGRLDERRVLRIVYRKENDTILVITFYPAKRGRYF